MEFFDKKINHKWCLKCEILDFFSPNIDFYSTELKQIAFEHFSLSISIDSNALKEMPA